MTVKQQQIVLLVCFLGRIRESLRFLGSVWASLISKTPNRSIRVSMLVRAFMSKRSGLFDADTEPAWSLCCQQYSEEGSARYVPLCFAGDPEGEEFGEDASARRHGRPFAVTPLHVVAGLSESVRETIDSGVLAI
jgi:hypothetical protein